MERAGDAAIGLTFSKGFFDTALKDLIKQQPYSRYDAEKRSWIIPLQDKERLLEAIGDYCVDNNILVDDIPPFVD